MTTKTKQRPAERPATNGEPAAAAQDIDVAAAAFDVLAQAIAEQLAAPFDAGEVLFKPAVVSGNRAMALAYIDARTVQDRLDEVLGPVNWSDTYVDLLGGCVRCRLSIRIGGEWITKEDVGSPSEQNDAGDRVKSAYSDALKRAAVKFGVGRYLYRLPRQWCDYDPARKQFAQTPKLPDWAVRAPQGAQAGDKGAAAAAAPEPAGPAAAEAPAAAPPEASRSAPQPDGGPPQDHIDLVHKVHELVGLSSHRSWKRILPYLGCPVPRGWPDPDAGAGLSHTMAAVIARLLTTDQLKTAIVELSVAAMKNQNGAKKGK